MTIRGDERARRLERIIDLFYARSDVYPRAYMSGADMKYTPACGCTPNCAVGSGCRNWRPLQITPEAVYAHLCAPPASAGLRTIGVEQIKQDARRILANRPGGPRL